MEGKKLSILVPVFNGEDGLKSLLTCAIRLNPNSEIIVVDDCSSNINTSKILSTINISNLHIFRNEQRLGMRNNYLKLLEKAKGEWITLIGQDDLIIANLEKIIDNVEKNFNDIKLIQSNRNYIDWLGDKKVKLKISNSNKINIKQSEIDLDRLLNGKINYLDLPKIYTGTIFHRELIFQDHTIISELFANYSIPDVGSAIFFANAKLTYVSMRTPLFLIGTSKKSTGRSINLLQDINDRSRNIRSNLDSNYKSFVKQSFGIKSEVLPGMNGKINTFSYYTYEALLSLWNSRQALIHNHRTLKNFLAYSLAEEMMSKRIFKISRIISLYKSIDYISKFDLISILIKAIITINLKYWSLIQVFADRFYLKLKKRYLHKQIYYKDENEIIEFIINQKWR